MNDEMLTKFQDLLAKTQSHLLENYKKNDTLLANEECFSYFQKQTPKTQILPQKPVQIAKTSTNHRQQPPKVQQNVAIKEQNEKPKDSVVIQPDKELPKTTIANNSESSDKQSSISSSNLKSDDNTFKFHLEKLPDAPKEDFKDIRELYSKLFPSDKIISPSAPKVEKPINPKTIKSALLLIFPLNSQTPLIGRVKMYLEKFYPNVQCIDCNSINDELFKQMVSEEHLNLILLEKEVFYTHQFLQNAFRQSPNKKHCYLAGVKTIILESESTFLSEPQEKKWLHSALKNHLETLSL